MESLVASTSFFGGALFVLAGTFCYDLHGNLIMLDLNSYCTIKSGNLFSATVCPTVTLAMPLHLFDINLKAIFTMHLRSWLAFAVALIPTNGAASVALVSSVRLAQNERLPALVGEWIYVEDRTEERPLGQQGPSMSAKFARENN